VARQAQKLVRLRYESTSGRALLDQVRAPSGTKGPRTITRVATVTKGEQAPQPRAALVAALGLLWLASCGVTQGALLHARDASPEPDAGAAADAGGAQAMPPTAASDPDLRVRPGMRLHYQISGALDLTPAADVYVTDLFDTRPEQVSALHMSGRLAMAYYSAGSFEPWRADAADFPSSALGGTLADYPDERWLDIRSPSVRAIMRVRLMRARDKGFDGVLAGSLGAYRADSGLALSEADQLDFDQFLAREARALGLTPGLSGDFALAAQLVAAHDWAVAFGCLAADECERLRPFLDRDKAVFDLETSGELSELCPRARALGIMAARKNPSYDAWSKACP